MACMESHHRVAMLRRLPLDFIALKSSFGHRNVFPQQVFHLGPTLCKLCYVLVNPNDVFFKRHFRSFNVTAVVMLWQSRPRYSIPLQVMNLGV